MTDYSEFFSGDGPFAGLVHGFAPRPQQQAMAESVGKALDAGEALAVEAGTGIGKTFAYLVPALLSGRRVIISTGTRNLQDQLFHRDLPTVSKAIGAPVNVALLKGRANYLCLHRLAQAVDDDAPARGSGHLAAVNAWSRHTESGDRGEVKGVPEDSPVWPQVTSTTDNCLGARCPVYDECFVVRARREAQEADVVVVNHYLLLADLALKEEGFGDILPPGDAVILDEAHQVPEIAAQFFGSAAGSRQVALLCRDVQREALAAGLWEEELEQRVADAAKWAREARLALPRAAGSHGWERVSPQAQGALEAAVSAVGRLAVELKPIAEASPGLESCLKRSREVHTTWKAIILGPTVDEGGADGDRKEPPAGVRWLRTTSHHFSLHLTPLNTAEQLGAIIHGHNGAWVFASATLAVGEDFSHFLRRVGAPEATTLRLDSPFDYAANALLWLPPSLPEPGDPAFTRSVCEAVLPVITASGGGAFALFTSHRALREAAEWFADRLPEELPLLVQGSAPRDELLVRFRDLGNGVLLGTGSFWEGVDVRGAALRVVAIDKLPFASPSDPVFKERLNAIRRGGGNPFMEYQVPQAVIALKQGAGRLIRDVTDRGVLALCDPRLTVKSYGRVFLNSLPDMPVTSSAEDAAEFARLAAVAGGMTS
ncbi:MAG: ATP-dependent DNA helicase [Pseudomonadota bacterium]